MSDVTDEQVGRPDAVSVLPALRMHAPENRCVALTAVAATAAAEEARRAAGSVRERRKHATSGRGRRAAGEEAAASPDLSPAATSVCHSSFGQTSLL